MRAKGNHRQELGERPRRVLLVDGPRYTLDLGLPQPEHAGCPLVRGCLPTLKPGVPFSSPRGRQSPVDETGRFAEAVQGRVHFYASGFPLAMLQSVLIHAAKGGRSYFGRRSGGSTLQQENLTYRFCRRCTWARGRLQTSQQRYRESTCDAPAAPRGQVVDSGG